MKKIVSILLCMVMVLSMCAVTFADGEMLTTTLLTAPTLIAPNPQLDVVIAPNPQEELDILVSPATMTEAEIKEALAGFTDYKEGEWYVEGLAFCVANKLMNGTSEKTISPAKKITRGEVVTMLYRLAGKPAFMNENIFTDVKSGEYYEKAVIWAQGKDIVNGTASDKFSPDQNITREDLITMIFNYVEYDLQEKGENTGILYPNLALTYADTNKISDWATSAIRWATAEKIIQGKLGNLVDPQGLASRAEAAAIFQRLGRVPSGLLQDIPEGEGMIAGGWTKYTYDGEFDMSKIPERAKEAFEKATAAILGASYKPVDYLGSQVVAGTNFKFVCEVTTVTAQPVTSTKEVVIFYALDGTATITSVTDAE